MNVTDRFIEEIHEFANKEFTSEDISQAKKCLIDYICVTNAGVRLLEAKVKHLLDANKTTEEGFKLIGLDKKTSQYNALLINSLSAHAAELDDGVRYANLHPGISVITALLTLGKSLGLSGTDLLRGILVGYEVSIRIAASIQPSHRNMGYHATGTCGSFGVALGLCAATHQAKETYKVALTAAASGSSGMLNTMKDQSDLKPFNNSLAVFSGFHAFNLAKAGFMASVDVLNGKWGYLGMKSKEVDLSRLSRPAEDNPLIHDIYRKFYAACRHCHPAIEAAILNKKRHGFSVNSIETVEVFTYSLAVDGHDTTLVRGESAAKMSTPYSVAVALLKEQVGINEFRTELIDDEEIRSLTKKVKVIHDQAMTDQVPQRRPARVLVKLKDGTAFEAQVDLSKGEPESPISDEELEEKFFALMGFNKISLERSRTILDLIYSIEQKAGAFWNVIN